VRLAWLLSLLVAAVAASPGATAQERTKPPLRILLPLPAGSTSDSVARLLAERLREDLGQPILVEDRPGASGRIAVEALMRAPPDGSTLLLAPIAVPVIVPLAFRKPGFDPARDLAPVAQVSTFEYALAVAANHPARNVAEFVAWAKINRARATFGTPGAGSVPHFLGTMLGRAAGVELIHVAYRGAPQVDADLMSGQIAAGLSALADFVALHRAGKLRILATSGAARSPLVPSVATFREQGYPSLEATGWHGVFAPAGTPLPVIERLSAAIVAALRTADLRDRLTSLGVEPTGTTPAELAAIMAADIARWRTIVRETGFKPE
jgi:tripartite-type tricarboxylate transporter receptor subunit TctC